MQKRFLFCVCLLAGIFFSLDTIQAALHYLPRYQANLTGRYNQGGNNETKLTCSQKGMYDKPTDSCQICQGGVGDCCASISCSTSSECYQYSEADASKYTCSDSCTDGNGTHYKTCKYRLTCADVNGLTAVEANPYISAGYSCSQKRTTCPILGISFSLGLCTESPIGVGEVNPGGSIGGPIEGMIERQSVTCYTCTCPEGTTPTPEEGKECTISHQVGNNKCYTCEEKELCPLGTYGEDCTPCPAGSYSDTVGASSCRGCPAGYKSKSGVTGATSQDAACEICPQGTYKTNIGAGSCTACPTGYTPISGVTGATSMLQACTLPCVQCSSSTYPLTSCPSHAVCEECTPKNCEDTATRYKISYCEDGYTLVRNACLEIKEICLPGTYGEGCKPCPAGSYSDTAGATSCKGCPGGYASKSGVTGATSQAEACQICPEGSYKTNTGAGSCTPCPVGYQSKSGVTGATSISLACQICPEGSYKTNTGAGSCTLCPAGYASKSGVKGASSQSSACEICPEGTYKTNSGTGVCTPCPAGYSSKPVTGSNRLSRSCGVCPAGTYKTNTGAGSCTSCPAGYTAISGVTGATSLEKACTAKCPGYITGGDCADGQTKETCADDASYYKCTGIACESGYSTAPKIPAINSNLCKVTQSSNTQCTKLIDAGTCGTGFVNINSCQYGTKSCTNTCGEQKTRCCTQNETGCTPPLVLPGFDSQFEACQQCGSKGAKPVTGIIGGGTRWQCCTQANDPGCVNCQIISNPGGGIDDSLIK